MGSSLTFPRNRREHPAERGGDAARPQRLPRDDARVPPVRRQRLREQHAAASLARGETRPQRTVDPLVDVESTRRARGGAFAGVVAGGVSEGLLRRRGRALELRARLVGGLPRIAERGDEVRPRVLELEVFRLHVRGPARGVVGAGEAAGGGRDVSFASVGFEAATGWEAPSRANLGMRATRAPSRVVRAREAARADARDPGTRTQRDRAFHNPRGRRSTPRAERRKSRARVRVASS
eukprot:2241-Pelagococcus_subviridis.AAC.2